MYSNLSRDMLNHDLRSLSPVSIAELSSKFQRKDLQVRQILLKKANRKMLASHNLRSRNLFHVHCSVQLLRPQAQQTKLPKFRVTFNEHFRTFKCLNLALFYHFCQSKPKTVINCKLKRRQVL